MPGVSPGSVRLPEPAESGRSVASLGVRRLLGPSDRLGQPPVDHQGLAVGAQQDVVRLEVAVQDAPAVCVGHRVADVEEPAEQLAQRQGPLPRVAPRDVRLVEVRDGVLEVVPLDEPHGVERPAVGVGAQAVDRDDPRMLQPAGDLGLLHEAGPAVGVVGVSVADLLEGHLAVQLLVAGDVDGAQAAGPVQPQDAEPHAGGGGGAGRAGMRGRGVRVRTLVGPGGRG